MALQLQIAHSSCLLIVSSPFSYSIPIYFADPCTQMGGKAHGMLSHAVLYAESGV